jgi:sugar O-acyltransferase (sialic acid O-acetyltransferase NeuD family)
MTQNRLAILGASGHGKVVADAALMAGWVDVFFFDDAWPELTELGPWQVIGNTSKLLLDATDFNAVVVAIGNNVIRLEKQQELEERGIQLVTIIHPSAIVSSYSKIGNGSVVFAGAVINAFAIIGCGCIINTGSTIDHDCLLADGVHISPGAHLAGMVIVGKATWIGIGASVKHGIHIGDNVMVGAGAAVVHDIESGVTVVGVPARELILRNNA